MTEEKQPQTNNPACAIENIEEKVRVIFDKTTYQQSMYSSSVMAMEKGTWLQARYVVAFACTFFNTVFFLMRINLSVAIVAIALDSSDSKNNAPTYDWDSKQRGIVLSSFFWSYTAMQLPYSLTVQRFGSKWTGFVMTLFSSLFTFLFVPAAALGWQVAALSRILLGCSQAGLTATVHSLLARWAPPEERGIMVVYAYGGQQLGTILGLATSGVLSESLGWPSVFYSNGVLGLVLAVVWWWLVEDSPAQHRMASPKEKKYIETALAVSIQQQEQKNNLKTPWRAIMTSVPFYALISAQCTQSWGYWTLLTGIPTYMSGVLDFDLTQNGVLSSLPYVAMWCTSFYSPTIMLTVLSFVPTDPTSAVIILIVTLSLNAACLVGHTPNQLDLSPNFVAALVAVGNTFACSMAIIGPIITGYIVTDYENEDQWEIIFLLTAGIYFMGNTVFVTFGSAKVQPWNDPDWPNNENLQTVSEENTEAEEEMTITEGKGTWISARYIVAIVCSLLNAIFFIMRINLSVTIVAIALENHEESGNVTHAKIDAPHYDWDAVQRSTILSSFFWGNTVLQLPVVPLVHRLGPKRAVMIMIVLSTVVTFLFVPAASYGWQVACAARVMLGFSQAGMMASVHTLLARWAPPEERSRMVVYSSCGQQIGTIVALASSGVLCENVGWPSVFYMNGSLGLVLGVVWLWLIEDSPAQHRFASVRERRFIETSLASSVEEQQHKTRLKTPWKAVLKSVPFYSLVAAQCAQAWGYWTLLTGIPSYMRGDGILSSLPYLAMWITSLVLAWGADELIKRGVWSIDVSRKLGNVIGLYGPAVMLIILCYVNPDSTTAVIFLIVAMGLNAGCLIGHTPNHLDLSPNFVAALLGLGNSFACTMSIIGPLLTGFIVTDNESAEQWQMVFLVSAGIYIVGNTFFVVFGSAKNYGTHQKKKTAQQRTVE
ncbi:hypothetical protein B566_EDAN006447 [Ephemera danica]|nr:hypothetical protein B566_EDAN006447 [Ephemera danica]